MRFQKMMFKGKQVFVEVDDNGQVVQSRGRANMKYREDDERIYNPAVANLSGPGEGIGDMLESGPPVGPSKTKKSLPASAKAPSVSPVEGTIVAYTDGGCIGNPGPSGLGYVIRYPDNRVIQKGEPLGNGTNNIAELTAILRVLETVTDTDAPLWIHTDSSYAIGVLTRGWKAKANQQLIAEIRQKLSGFSNVKLIKVKGHAGNPDNELVDTLANGAARTQNYQ